MSPSTPKGSNKKTPITNKNPYSGRGLDKFSSVLDDLRERKEKIMSKTGVSVVQFKCKNSQDWVPIVVKMPDHQQQRRQQEEKSKKALAIQPKTEVAKESPPAGSKGSETVVLDSHETGKKKSSSLWSLLRWRPSHYRPEVVIAVLILLCLLLFGRVLAASGTCIWFGATWCPR